MDWKGSGWAKRDQVGDKSHSLGYTGHKERGGGDAGCVQIREIWRKQNL